jgi:magnesium-transporting ATPase (P-type)
MWRQIIGMTIYISFVMFIMFWFNEDIWGFTYEMNDAWMDGLSPSNKTKAFTMLFNMFIYMHLFNLINCREVKPSRKNVFSEISNNFFFILAFTFIAVTQYLLVQWGGTIFRTAPLDGKQHAYCVILGLTVFIPSFALKLLPSGMDFLTKRLKINDGVKKHNEE